MTTSSAEQFRVELHAEERQVSVLIVYLLYDFGVVVVYARNKAKHAFLLHS